MAASPLLQEQLFEEAEEAFYHAVQAGTVQPEGTAGIQGHTEFTPVPEDWVERIRQWYPELLQRVHFLPHVYMYRAKHEKTKLVSGTTVRKPPLEKDEQEDRSQQDVLDCLRTVAKTGDEVMFVLSQMNFGDYLGKSSYNPAAKQFRRPIERKSEGLHKGESDIIVIHRRYGLLLAEIKSVGGNVDMLKEPQDKQDKIFARKVEEAAKQLRHGRKVLEHILSDYRPPPRVRGTLMLPNIPRSELQRLLAENPKVKKVLCESLDLDPSADPMDLCLCSDQISNSSTDSDKLDTSPYCLEYWWHHSISGAGEDPAMNEQVFEDMVARFAGPATLVRVYCQTEPRLRVTDLRSEGHFVSETGDRLSAFFLHPYQVDLIHMAPDLAFLAGPPGTGKTLTAVVMGLEWLRHNKAVDVLSGDDESRAAAHLIAQQIKVTAQQTLGTEAADRVRLHLKNLQENNRKDQPKMADAVADLVKTLTESAVENEICLIADETTGNVPGLGVLYENLTSHPNNFRVRLWAASLLPSSAPLCLKQHVHLMTAPLRCPPYVVAEVEKADDLQNGEVPKYTAPPAPPPCKGPPVHYLHHQGRGHTKRTMTCETCGREIARILKEVLHVGQGGAANVSSSSSSSSSTPALNFRDVFLLASLDFSDDEADDDGHVIRPASGVVRGLRQAGVPVRVVEEKDEAAVAEMATMSGLDSVTAACEDKVQGLERKIVVWLEERDHTGEVIYGQLHGLSRTTAQLLWVKHRPLPADANGEEDDFDEDDDDDADDIDIDLLKALAANPELLGSF